MRESIVRMFIKRFIISFFTLLFIFGAGTLSYYAVIHFLSIKEPEAVVAFRPLPEAKTSTEASVDDISRNLIFSYNDKTGKINKILLEIYHCKDKQLYYITIPVKTQFTMSDTLYQQLIPTYPSIPQIVMLSGITDYFEKDNVYDNGVLLIEDLLQIDISYYTAVPNSVYKTIFTSENVGKDTVVKPSTLRKEIFTSKYIKFIKTLKTQDDIEEYIEKIYPSLKSNLSLAEKLSYLECYSKTSINSIHFEMMKGMDSNSAYTIDSPGTKEQLDRYLRTE